MWSIFFFRLWVAGMVLALGGCRSRPFDGPPIEPSVAAACASYLSCRGDSGPQAVFTGVSDCLAQNAAHPSFLVTGLLESTPVDCLVAAGGDCDAVRDCLGGTVAKDCSGIQKDQGECHGNLKISCVLGVAQAEDCSAAGILRDPGGRCLIADNGFATCGFATCAPFNPSQSCDGDVQVTCQLGIEQRLSCANLGAQCVADQSGGAKCAGPGPPCTDYRCEGEELIACVGGHELGISCLDRPIAGTCVSDGNGTNCVPLPGLGCDPESYADHCSGSVIVYCDGAERTLDCGSLGFTTCGLKESLSVCL